MTEDTTRETVQTDSPAKNKKGVIVWVAAAIAVLLVVFGILKFGGNGSNSTNTAAVADGAAAVIASIDGDNITRGELDRKLEQVRAVVPPNAQDPTKDAGFEVRLLDELINLHLLLADASKKGITASDDEVKKEIQGLVTRLGGEDKLSEQLKRTGLTNDEFTENVKNEIIIRKLIDATTDIKSVMVSDTEVKDAYEQAFDPKASTTPKLDSQLTEVIRAQLIQQKSAQVVNDYIEKLKTAAKIEKSL